MSGPCYCEINYELLTEGDAKGGGQTRRRELLNSFDKKKTRQKKLFHTFQVIILINKKLIRSSEMKETGSEGEGRRKSEMRI